MPLGIWNVQWLNQNSQRSYPLTDWSTGRPVGAVEGDGIEIPDNFIVALYFPVHAGLEVQPERFFIRDLGVYPTGYNIGIGYDDDSSDPPLVGVVNIAKSTHVENTSYAVAGVNDFDDCVGKIAIGKLNDIDRIPPGQYTFTRAGAALEVDCIWPNIRGIVSLTVVNGQERSDRLYGDIELIAGDNMRITAVDSETADPSIIFSAIDGEGLNEQCICEEELEGPCIRYINGIPPYPDGNFRMIGDDCMELFPIEHGIQIRDVCSEPCCGCEELDALVRQIDRFADGVMTLQNFASRLSSEVTQMSQVVLGSRLADQGCVEC